MRALQEVCLSDVADLSGGHAFKSEDYSSSGIFVLRTINIQDDYTVSRVGAAYIPNSITEKYERFLLKEFDTLFVMVGATLGKTGIVKRKDLPALLNQNMWVIRAFPEKINPLFLHYKFRELSQEVSGWVNGSARGFLRRDDVRNLKFLMPDMKAQHVIASILGSLDDKIDLNRRTNETLEAMARALFRDWFVDFGPTKAKMAGESPYLAPELWELFPDRLDDEGKPDGWEVCNFDELVSINPKEKLSRDTIAPYLSMSELPTQGCLSEAPIPRPFSGGSKFRNGDTLFARITPCLENGKTALAQNLENNIVGWGSTEFHVLRGKGDVPFSWVYLMARDNEFRTNAIRGMTGTSGRQRVASEVLATYKTVTPSSNQVWKAFDRACNPLFEKIIINGVESRTLAQLRDLLLPKLMSGEISLRDAEKIVEDAA